MKTMEKLFYDFEFTRFRQDTNPISVGIVSENEEKAFYAEFTDYNPQLVDDWLRENILCHLQLIQKPDPYFERKAGVTTLKGSVKFIVTSPGGLADWLATWESRIQFASFGSGYDWVLLRELFRQCGLPLPAQVSHWNYDVSTLFQEQGYDLEKNEYIKEHFLGLQDVSQKHHALFDAHVARQIYLKLKAS